MPPGASDSRRGAASVEHVALAALVAVVAIAAISSLAAAPDAAKRGVGETIAGRIACAPRLPAPCRRHPLALAYGFPLGKLARALAPDPLARPGPGGEPLLPVDFRRCRQPTCAGPRPGDPHLTASNRRVTAFTEVIDGRRRGGWIEVVYWLYRPRLGWERLARRAGRADVEAASGIRLRVGDHPVLVPLETLPGRNHYEFPLAEEPPWRWRVEPVYPG